MTFRDYLQGLRAANMKWQMDKTKLLIVGSGIVVALVTAVTVFLTCGG
jgi:hypothetical protein